MQIKKVNLRPPITSYRKSSDLSVIKTESVSEISNDDDREVFMMKMFDQALTAEENDMLRSSSFSRKHTLQLFERLTGSQYQKAQDAAKRDLIRKMPLEKIRKETLQELHSLNSPQRLSVARRVLQNDEITKVRTEDAAQGAKRTSRLLVNQSRNLLLQKNIVANKVNEIDSKMNDKVRKIKIKMKRNKNKIIMEKWTEQQAIEAEQ